MLVYEPVGVEDGGCVAAKQRDLVGELSSLVQRDNGKGTAAGRVPVHRKVLRVDLYRQKQHDVELSIPTLGCSRLRCAKVHTP